MPELPDLQVFSKNLQQAIAGKKVKEIKVYVTSKLNVSEEALQKALKNKTLEVVKRVGKELHFEFSEAQVLGIHLMLNGELHLYVDDEPPKHCIMEMTFEKGPTLALTDFRKMATLTLNPESSAAPDAMADDIDSAFFKNLFTRKSGAIKTILLDQKIIRGIGNAYADEILWQAGISPFSLADKIPEAKIKALVKAIKDTLKSAEEQLLQKHPDIISGEYREFLKIHGSKIKQSPTGATVLVKKVGSRKTYYTDEQEYFS
jgi:formamidopyrimidine-DNA glycosylase